MNYYSRKFLNPKKGVALIECSAEMQHGWSNVCVKITDCNRTISLDIDFDSFKTYKEKRTKLTLMISEIQSLLTYVDDKVKDPEFRKAMKWTSMITNCQP
jgi:hypothetical protein